MLFADSTAVVSPSQSPASSRAPRLFEKYRPRDWSQVIAQDKVIRKLQRLEAAGEIGGNAFLFSGSSGTGKTAISHLLAESIASELAIEEINGKDLTVSKVEEMERSSRNLVIGEKHGRAFIVNEAHLMTPSVVGRLLTAIDTGFIPSHVVWIFTTTSEGIESFEGKMDSAPFLSRCLCFALARRDLATPFAQHLLDCAVLEGLDGGRFLKDFVKLLQDCRNNLRAAFCRIQAGEFLD